jgi:beta-1,4-mannooligosaccharide phosphorylase
MWISYSPDLRYWGRHRLMLEARRGAWWDANKIGLSPPPVETSRGWLVFYHGVRHTPCGCLYRLGLTLFDLENPEKVPAARRFVDLWTGGKIRASRRCARCRVSLWIHDGRRWRHDQHLLRGRGLCNCPGSGQRAISTGLAAYQWKLRAPPTSAGFMKLVLGIFQFVFGCRHRHLSRVLTIKHRTYKVCFDCGREFDLPDPLGARSPDPSPATRLRTPHYPR